MVVLHVFNDDKFFDGIARFFLELSNVKNLFCYYSKNKKPYKYIKNEKIVIRYSDWNKYTDLFHDPDVDIIYFHSLPVSNYKLFKYIDDKKIVIWWCWGYDIYNSYGLLPPFLKLDMFKPLTCQVRKRNYCIFKEIIRTLKNLNLYLQRNKVLERIDYFSPVIPLEYKLMKNQYTRFKAKPFMLECGPGLAYRDKKDFIYKCKLGNVIVGNSLTFSNNHLDIFKIIENIKLSNDRSYIIPISYPKQFDADVLKQETLNFCAKIIWLETFLPAEEYKQIYKSITHAIFGHIRQQAMGNIYFALINGVKIFLYRDSLIYEHLKTKGYIVFTIEDDLNDMSLNEVLTEEQAFHNYQLYYQIVDNKLKRTELELQKIIKMKI